MRTIWSGALNFGLVNIPVSLYRATESGPLNFHYLHKTDLSPIRFARVCRAEEKEVSFPDLVKGYEYREGSWVTLADKDFENANRRSTKTIGILYFSREREIDPNFFEKPFYLEPAPGAERPYALLRETLKRSETVGVASFVIRWREHPAVIRPVGNVLVLNQLRFQSEMRSTAGLNIPELARGKEAPSKMELETAIALVGHMTMPFRPEELRDAYIEDLRSIIAAKAEGEPFAPKEEAPRYTKVGELMSALRASLEARAKSPD